MDLRQTFLNYVTNGGPPICSPQIGAGAGFDARLAGKEWVSQTTPEDTIAAVERFDIVPLINIGLCDLGACAPELAWRESGVITEHDRVVRDYALTTPSGELRQRIVEQKFSSGMMLKSPVKEPSELDALEWYIDAAIDADLAPVMAHTADAVTRIAGRAALCAQWPVQPYELWCFPSTVDTVMIQLDAPARCRDIMSKILVLDERIMRAVAEGGADFIFLGGPAAEMISPTFYRELIVPYSQQASAIAHSLGLMVYSHICSPIEPFLTMGFYNRMGIDLFETLSEPPVGNVQSLADAMTKIEPAICTRGNLGLDVLLNGSPDDVREKTLAILEATRGRKHIVAASDYLFYGVKEENVEAMAETVREFSGGEVLTER